MAPSVSIIGIDWSSDKNKQGLAFAEWDDETITQLEISPPGQLIEVAASRIKAASSTLIAIDAPLSWPAELGSVLQAHVAGERISRDPTRLFTRETDRSVAERFKNVRPLEVGASWMARSTYRAIEFLGKLRDVTAHPIPLAWSSEQIGKCSAIEVYPSATFRSYAKRMNDDKQLEDAIAKYKGSDEQALESRSTLAEMVFKELQCGVVEDVLKTDHLTDALACILAARDFLIGRSSGPSNRSRAEKEGWIWVADPDPQTR